MGLSRDDYLSQLQALLPTGPAWPTEADTYLTRVLDGLAEEFARVDARSAQLYIEADPRTTFELLSDFEQDFGLSAFSIIDGSALSIEQRRTNLISRMTERGGQSRAYFISKALKMGFVVTITEFREWGVDCDVESLLCQSAWNFAWQINAPLTTSGDWTVESDVETPFAVIWLNALLESAMHEDKPAHTVLLFNFS